MDKISKNTKNVSKGVGYYKKEISEKVSDIKELWILKEVLKFIINMTKEG